MPDLLEDPPALVDPPSIAGQEFDVSQLDPANMLAGTMPKPAEPDPAKPAEPDPAKPKEEPPVMPDPKAKPEPKNFAELRKLREAAEKDRDTFKTERDALAAKLADLEPKATSYEKERETLQQQLKDREDAIAVRDAAMRRVSARETPEWKTKAEAIHAVAKSVEELLDTPELKEAGIVHSVETLLNPHAKAQLNETFRALNEAGKFVEAQDLMEAHRSVQVWRGELRKIEADTAEEAKTWTTQREATLSNTFRGVREQLATANPIHDPRSAEYLALPKEGQDYLNDQHKGAQEVAQAMIGLKPEQLAAEAYRSALALRLTSKGLENTVARAKALETENADLKAKVATYEKAAGGASPVGGGTGGGAPNDTSPEEEARRLDPRNMAGYGGIGK